MWQKYYSELLSFHKNIKIVNQENKLNELIQNLEEEDKILNIENWIN